MWLERDAQLALEQFGKDLQAVRPQVRFRLPRRRRSKRWPHLRAKTQFSMWQPLPFGVRPEGRRVSLRLVGRHLLIGGMSGGGKSVAMSMICAEAANDPNADLWLLDAKLLELWIWEERACAFAGPEFDKAIEVLQRIRDEIDVRMRTVRALAYDRRVPIRAITPDMGMRLQVVVIDELGEYTDRGRAFAKEQSEFTSLLQSIVRIGRSFGVIVVAATQKPQASTVPSQLRDLFQHRFALRCSTPQMSETILGQGAATRGADASKLPERPGLGLLGTGETHFQRVQTYFLTDKDLANLAGLGEGS